MMDILHFSPVGTIGGAEMCLLDLLAASARDRPDWRPSVILGDDGPLRLAVESLGVRCLVAPMPDGLAGLGDSGGVGPGLLGRMARSVPASARYLAGLRRLIRSGRPDVVQTNGMKAHLLGALATPRAVPVVWHLHDYLGSRAAMARLLRVASRRGGLSVVAVSRSVAEDARRVLGSGVPVRAIHNAADLLRFAPGPGDPSALDRAAGQPDPPPGTVRVGMVATFARWKGHRAFLDAVALLGSDCPARFSIVGGPIYRSAGSQWTMAEMRAEVASRGLADRVGLVGPVADAAPALRSLDVAVHASTRPEPFGRSIVEAMASGVATVAIRDGGAAELFEDGVSALGCPPGDPAALARAIGRLIADPGLRRALGEAGRREAEARFDADRLAEAWSTVYPGGPPGRPGRRSSGTEVLQVHGR